MVHFKATIIILAFRRPRKFMLITGSDRKKLVKLQATFVLTVTVLIILRF